MPMQGFPLNASVILKAFPTSSPNLLDLGNIKDHL
jgi:hypothetical protein